MSAVLKYEPTPIIPVQYDTAVRALAECVSLDEAKLWSDKADALAAWSKIYSHDEAGIAAKRLKLHAYRRIGLLAAELRPQRHNDSGRKLPGPKSLLREHGFPPVTQHKIGVIAKLPQAKFDALITGENVPTPTALMNSECKNPGWNEVGRLLGSARCSMRRHLPADLVNAGGIDLVAATALCNDMIEWIVRFKKLLHTSPSKRGSL